MRRKQETDSSRLFWVSYADLMTALFIVALALFVLSYKMFKMREDILIKTEAELKVRSLELDKKSVAIQELTRQLSEEEMHASALIEDLNTERARLLVMEEEYLKLQEIQKAIEQLDPRYFMYQPEFKRHVLRTQVEFKKGSTEIDAQYENMLMEAGRALEGLVAKLDPDDNIKYLLIIEGMSSQDAYTRNFELSYERALSLSRFWEERGIKFDPNRVELQLAGSGQGGVGRNEQDERKNQRFLIQIVPKIGQLKGVEDIYQQADSSRVDSSQFVP